MIVYLQRLSDKDILIVLCFIVTLKVVPQISSIFAHSFSDECFTTT